MTEMKIALLEEVSYLANIDCLSTQLPIEILAEKTISRALALCPNEARANFVTHSMGGILVREYFSHHSVEKLDRVVMLGPPNQGSEVVDELKNVLGFHLINDDAGLQLGTDAQSVPSQLDAANFDVDIIAGTQSTNWLLSMIIPSTDDGKVSMASTRLNGVKDHLTMPVSHTFMKSNKDVITQTIYYLRHGYFFRAE
jgi:hypothetical protein